MLVQSGREARIGRQVREDLGGHPRPGVHAAQVDRCERAHGQPARRQAVADRGVDRGDVGHLLVNQPQSLAQQRVLQPVPHEPRHVATGHDRRLAHLGGQVAERADGLVRGGLARDDLHYRGQIRRVQEVQPRERFGPRQAATERADGQPRGVGSQDRVPAEPGRDQRVHPRLDLEVLGHGLHDEASLAEGARLKCTGRYARARQLGRSDRPFERAACHGHPRTRLGQGRRYAGSHAAGTEHDSRRLRRHLRTARPKGRPWPPSGLPTAPRMLLFPLQASWRAWHRPSRGGRPWPSRPLPGPWPQGPP